MARDRGPTVVEKRVADQQHQQQQRKKLRAAAEAAAQDTHGAATKSFVEVKVWETMHMDEGWTGRLVGLAWLGGKVEERWAWTPPGRQDAKPKDAKPAQRKRNSEGAFKDKGAGKDTNAGNGKTNAKGTGNGAAKGNGKKIGGTGNGAAKGNKIAGTGKGAAKGKGATKGKGKKN